MRLILLQPAILYCGLASAGKKKGGGKPKSAAVSQHRTPIFRFRDNMLGRLDRPGELDDLDCIFSIDESSESPSQCAKAQSHIIKCKDKSKRRLLLELIVFVNRIAEIVNFLEFYNLKYWPAGTLENAETKDVVMRFVNILALNQRHKSAQNRSEIPEELRDVYGIYSDFQRLEKIFSPILKDGITNVVCIFRIFYNFENFCFSKGDGKNRVRSDRDIARLIAGRLKELKEHIESINVGDADFIDIFASFEISKAPDAEKEQKRQTTERFIAMMKFFCRTNVEMMTIVKKVSFAYVYTEVSIGAATSVDEEIENPGSSAWIIMHEFERLKFMEYCRSGEDKAMERLVRQDPDEFERMLILLRGAFHLENNSLGRQVIRMIFDEFLFPKEASQGGEAAVSLDQYDFDSAFYNYETIFYYSLIEDNRGDVNPGAYQGIVESDEEETPTFPSSS